MSLSVPSSVIASAQSTHLFRRQDVVLEEPPFQCTVRPNSHHTIINPPTGINSTDPPFRQPPPNCPDDSVLNDLVSECVYKPPVGTKSWKPKGNGKAECAETCKMVYNGTWEAERWKCWESGCTDAKGENEATNQKYIDYEIYFWKVVYCDPLGLNATTAEEAKEEKEEKEDKKDAPTQDKDSAAGALGAGKVVFLVAAVFGFAFSGFM